MLEGLGFRIKGLNVGAAILGLRLGFVLQGLNNCNRS